MTRHRSPIAVLATLVWLFAISTGAASAASPAPSAPPPGPPFPAPEVDRAVYDYAGILSPEAIAAAEAAIDAYRGTDGLRGRRLHPGQRTFPSTDETEAKARALMDQWGVGRKGFNDGLVIFFDMQPNLEHGQVQLYAGPGFEAAFLSNEERQSIFQNDMLPFLAAGDFDAALAAALEKVDAAATPEHADALQRSRQINAVVGLVGGSVVFLGLTGWAVFSWRRYGKDPVYLDDPSVHMPAPPPDLTAASGAMIMDGATSRRALTTAMLDLASRGYIAFRDQPGVLFAGHKVGVDVAPAAGDAEIEAQRRLNQRRPTGPAEQVALTRLQALAAGGDAFISPDDLPKFGTHVGEFDKALEDHVVDHGWFGERPSKVVSRWAGRGVLAIVGGVIALVAGLNIPLSGLTLLGGAAIAAGIVVVIIARSMPAVTIAGSMIRAMLAAYRRTLQKTMAQARSMQQVVDEAGLPWLDTPDQAVVWGTALGLQGEIEGVLSRSLEDVNEGRTSGVVPYFPIWYQTSSGTPFMSQARRRQWRQPVLRFGDPRRRRDDVGPGDDRELPLLVGRRRRLRRRMVRRRRRGRRRRVLAAVGRAACQAPNMSRQASSPSIASGGRGRARHSSSVIRKFCVVRATPSGARLPKPFSA